MLSVSATLLPIQLPATVPGKAAVGDNPTNLVARFHSDTY